MYLFVRRTKRKGRCEKWKRKVDSSLLLGISNCELIVFSTATLFSPRIDPRHSFPPSLSLSLYAAQRRADEGLGLCVVRMEFCILFQMRCTTHMKYSALCKLFYFSTSSFYFSRSRLREVKGGLHCDIYMSRCTSCIIKYRTFDETNRHCELFLRCSG